MESDSEDLSGYSRYTTSLSYFDKSVIVLIAKKRNQSLSNVIGNIIYKWIKSYPDILNNNYGIDINNIKEDTETLNHSLVNRDSSQRLEKYPNLQNSTKLSRITIAINSFNGIIINLMAKNKGRSRSFIIRNIVHSWIEMNFKIIKSNYNIDVNEIRGE